MIGRGWRIISSLLKAVTDITPVHSIRMMTSMIAKATSKFNVDSFRHPTLTREDHKEGCRLGIDSWADTTCSGKHAYVSEFIMGKSITAAGFTPALGQMEDLSIANVIYAYDTDTEDTILLGCNNIIYKEKHMQDSLINPIQCEEIDVRVDIGPKLYYENESSQSITFPDGTVIPI